MTYGNNYLYEIRNSRPLIVARHGVVAESSPIAFGSGVLGFRYQAGSRQQEAGRSSEVKEVRVAPVARVEDRAPLASLEVGPVTPPGSYRPGTTTRFCYKKGIF